MPDITPLLHGDPHEAGGYRLEGRLGAGGQGVVYLGRGAGGEPVAVKLLRAGLTAGEEDRHRFAREIAAARRVAPFCVAQVLDADPDAAQPYVVTEYVPGPSLARAGIRSGPDLHRLAIATATALAAVHEAGIVHRDFKPANVLLGPDGPRVIDFGIARALEGSATLSSHIVGTPAYMAPEQLAGASIGPAADVFAWGGVIVYAASARPPFGEDTLPAVMNRILTAPPDLGPLTEPLRSIVADALGKDPATRPTMIDIHLRLLGRAVPAAEPSPAVLPPAVPPPALPPSGFPPHATQPTAPPPHATQPAAPRRRRRVAVAGMTLAVLAAGATAVVLLPAIRGKAPGITATTSDLTSASTTPPSIPSMSATIAGSTVVTPGPTPSTTVPASPTATAATPSASPKAATFPARFAGVWRGKIRWDPGAGDFLVLTVRRGGRTITETYPGACTGTSKLVRINGDIATLKRVSMRGSCVRNGTITLSLTANGRLEVAYSGLGESEYTRGEPFTMYGELKRDS
ncbi:protein kinase [Sphaerisporangium sp. NPDC049002]|uniref:serine/threonine-protein kinase n=1 Tax=unclassified Sphaerisporangium TaxID=2630420 RepID=UPI0033D364EF